MTTTAVTSSVPAAATLRRQPELRRWLRLLRRPTTIFALSVLLTTIAVALLAPVLAPADPAEQATGVRLRPPGFTTEQRFYTLGTDQLGRDVLSRLIYGARISLLVSVLGVAGSGILGVILGLAAGYFGGKLDIILMRLVDVQMAFPFILLALSIVAILGPSLPNVIIVFIVTSWVYYARIVRGVALSLREQEFVSASRVLGAGDGRILVRHLLPNVLSPAVVLASFEAARIISSEAALSFLGLGIPAAIPSWGSMINDGREYLRNAWWIAVFPGLALMLLVVAGNFLGDALRDGLDPRSKTN